MLWCIVNPGYGSRALRVAKQAGVRGGTILRAKGTVKNRLLEILDLNDVRKEIVIMVAPENVAEDAAKAMAKQLAFHKPNHGICFNIPLAGLVGLGSRKNVDFEKVWEVSELTHYAIFTVVERGKAEEVIEAAQGAGSRGGTIINARGSGIHETETLFAMPVEPEREIVLILAERDSTEAIISSICDSLQIEKPGNGIIFTAPVNGAIGLA